MKIKAGNDERVWLFFRNIILIGGLLLILCPLWMVLINSFKHWRRPEKISLRFLQN